MKPSDFLNNYSFDTNRFDEWIDQLEIKKTSKRAKKLMELVDLTSLSSTDSEKTVIELLRKAKRLNAMGARVAALCTFPNFLRILREQSANENFPLAAVAGAFPLGQAQRKLKLKEVEYTVNEGAKEIDFVINRGAFLSGNLEEVFIEIRSARQLCEGKAELKVILENSDLGSAENIYVASMLALEAGAHFIKTSTGKGEYGARPQDFWVMCDAVKQFQSDTGEWRGIKVAGGIRTLEEATVYYEMAKFFFGKSFLKPELFRIGASSLVADLEKNLSLS